MGMAALLAGCGGRAINQVPGQAPRLLRIDWFGHQCFRIKSSLGISIVTNPFTSGAVDFEPPKGLAPEILLITNENAKANNVDLIENTPRILRGSVGIGDNAPAGVRITGVPIFKDPEKPDVSDLNVAYRWTMDGLKFCFLGDVRAALTREAASRIGAVDVLFLPVDHSDLTGSERAELIAQLRPRVIIPMGGTADIAQFASGFTAVYRSGSTAALISREALPAQQTVLVFKAP
jgi:L-ascorbate metabolism protein UlaG (beta-lactamase superfamily)